MGSANESRYCNVTLALIGWAHAQNDRCIHDIWISQWHRLTHWGQVMHICVSNLATIGSDNCLSPSRHQAIIGTNAGILLIGPKGTNLSEVSNELHTFSFKKMHLNVSSVKWQPFCLGLNELTPSNHMPCLIPHCSTILLCPLPGLWNSLPTAGFCMAAFNGAFPRRPS